MKAPEMISEIPRVFYIIYALLLILIPIVFTLFNVDHFRLFKSIYPRWEEVDEYAGQTAILFTLLLFGGISGYVTSRVTKRNQSRSNVSTVMLLRNAYWTSTVLTALVMVVSILLSVGNLQGFVDYLVLAANSLNVFALLSFTSSVGVLVFLVLNGDRRKRPSDVLKDESNSLVTKMVLASIVMIIVIRAIQALFVSSTAGWDSLYHNTLIASILEGGSVIEHPFYEGLQNVYPPLYHQLMASLVAVTGLPLDLLVIVKEIAVFIMLAYAMYNLSLSIGLGKHAALLSVPIVFANLPGGGNRPQSVALLLAVLVLYFLVSAQQNNKTYRSWLGGVFCGLLILTHFGLAIAMALILLVNLLYMLLKRDVVAVGLILNVLGVSAIVGSLFMIPTLAIFPLGNLLTIAYLVAGVFCIVCGPLLTHVLTRFVEPPGAEANVNDLPLGVHQSESHTIWGGTRIRLVVVLVFVTAVVWGILVGEHGYGLVSYATSGIFAPMGFLSILVVPFSILTIYEIGSHSNWRTRGAIYSFTAPSFIGLIVYLLNPFLISADTELYNIIGHLFAFNVYYLQLAIVGFAINASFYVTYVISPCVSSVGKLREARFIFRVFKTKEAGVFLLLMSVLLAGTVSCRVGELVQFATIGPLFELEPAERSYLESISQFTEVNDIVLSDAYTSSFIPMLAMRSVYFSIQPTANNFQAFEIGRRAASLKSVINGPTDELVRGLKGLNITAAFIWKVYPDYFRNISTTSSYIDFSNTIVILKLSPDVTVVAEDSNYIMVLL